MRRGRDGGGQGGGGGGGRGGGNNQTCFGLALKKSLKNFSKPHFWGPKRPFRPINSILMIVRNRIEKNMLS